MHKSDIIFGEARENAPPRQHVTPETPVFVGDQCMTYAEACALHTALGQTLARMLRKRGTATPPGGDIGGTPVAVAA